MSAQPGMTINTWKNTFNWLQFELGNQVGACNKPRPVGHIRRLKIVEDEAQKIKSSISDLEKTNENGEIVYFDTQSKLESDMPDEKKMMAVKAMLNNIETLNATPLNACNLLVEFMSTHTLSGRSENDRNEKISFNFIRHLKSIGPNGMKATCNVLNKGKMTKN